MSVFVPEEFLERFALPLVVGGGLHVGRPLDGDDLQSLAAEAASPGDALVRVETARLSLAQASWPAWVDTSLDDHSRRLLLGLHNTLFLGHPESERFTVRGARLSELVAFTRSCLELPPPANEAELVARHTLLANLSQLSRTDVEVRFWVGSRRFRGQTPPQRLLRWRGLRRVQRNDTQVRWLADETLSEAQRGLIELLFAASPLTALLTLTRPAPAMHWGQLVAYLARPRICRAVAHGYLREGLASTGPALAQAAWTLVAELRESPEEDPRPPNRGLLRSALQQVLQLGYYLLACDCLAAEPSLASASPSGSFRSGGGSSSASMLPDAEPTSSLAALLVVARRRGAVAAPGALGDPAVARRLEQLLAAASETLNPDIATVLGDHLIDALHTES